jgi:hypothetical protein
LYFVFLAFNAVSSREIDSTNKTAAIPAKTAAETGLVKETKKDTYPSSSSATSLAVD